MKELHPLLKYAISVVLTIIVNPAVTYGIENSVYRQCDSVRKVLPRLSGQGKLQAMYTIMDLAHNQKKAEYELKAIDDYILEAHKQSRFDNEAEGIASKMSCYYNYGMTKKMEAYLPSALEFHSSHKLWKSYYETWLIMANEYLFDAKIFTGMREMKKIYADAQKRKDTYGIGAALCGIGSGYMIMDNYKLSADAYAKGIALLKDNCNSSVLQDSYSDYCDMLAKMHKYHDMMNVTAQWKNTLDLQIKRLKKRDKGTAGYNTSYSYCYISMAEAEIALNRMADAKKHIKLSFQLAQESTALTSSALLSVKSKYYEKLKQYDNAITCVDTIIRNDMRLNDDVGAMYAKERRAQLLLACGRGAEAAALFNNVLQEKDSLTRNVAQQQLNELSTLSGLDGEKLRHCYTRNVLIGTMSCLVLLLIASAIIIGYNRKLQKKNEVLFNMINKFTPEPATEKDAGTTKPCQPADASKDLYERICQLMQDQELFKRQEANRKMIAVEIGSNENDVFYAIKNNGNAQVSEFINGYRVSYAAKQIVQDPTTPMTEVGSMSGFSSYQTFYKEFRKKFGMSPSEYQKMVMKRR